jgi:hypothetical protein
MSELGETVARGDSSTRWLIQRLGGHYLASCWQKRIRSGRLLIVSKATGAPEKLFPGTPGSGSICSAT